MMSNAIKDLTYPHEQLISFQMKWSKFDCISGIKAQSYEFELWEHYVGGGIVEVQ